MSVGPADLAVRRATLVHLLFARRGDPGACWRPADRVGYGVGPIHPNNGSRGLAVACG
jgi:hypothetical protein